MIALYRVSGSICLRNAHAQVTSAAGTFQMRAVERAEAEQLANSVTKKYVVYQVDKSYTFFGMGCVYEWRGWKSLSAFFLSVIDDRR